MAKVDAPALSMLASGRVGDIVYGRNQYGPWARPYYKPEQPDSPAQQDQRMFLAAAAGWWNARTEDERRAWEDAAKSFRGTDRLGRAKPITGRQLGMRLYIYAYRLFVGAINRPSLPYAPTYFPTITLVQDNDGIWMVPSEYPSNNSGIIVRAAAPANLTRNTCPAALAYVGHLNDTHSSPLLLRPNDALDTTTRRYWFSVRCVGRNYWPSPCTFHSIDAAIMPNEYIFTASTNNLINSSVPNDVTNAPSWLLVRRTLANQIKILLNFDISSIPGSEEIVTATLRLTKTTMSSVDTSHHIHIYPLAVAFTSSECTWNERASSTAWTAAGASSAGVDYHTSPTTSAECPTYAVNPTWDVDITAIVDAWHESAIDNHGIILDFFNFSSANNRYFRTRLDADPNLRPLLIIHTLPS